MRYIFENIPGIYCYENKINGKKYIGQSKDIRKRIKTHEKNFKKDLFENTKGENKLLWYSVKKYGRDNFNLTIIEYCDIDELDEKEIGYIKTLSSHVSVGGYNIQYGGKSTNRGLSLSLEHRNKIRESVSGDKNPFFGKTHTAESIELISIANKGKILSETHIQAIISTHKGVPKSDEQKEKIANSRIGIKNPNASSQFYGVSKKGNRWCASIKIKQKSIYLGLYKSEEEAAEAYDDYVIENSILRNLNFSERLLVDEGNHE